MCGFAIPNNAWVDGHPLRGLRSGMTTPGADDTVALEATVLRKDEKLPAYVQVPSSLIQGWALTGTTTVLAVLNGGPPIRRSLKPWDAGRWFIDLPRPTMRSAEIDVGAEVTLTLALAPTVLPDELKNVIASSPDASARWRGMTASQQRSVREHVLAGVRSETRRRRAEKALGCGGANTRG